MTRSERETILSCDGFFYRKLNRPKNLVKIQLICGDEKILPDHFSFANYRKLICTDEINQETAFQRERYAAKS